jgi:hypothetical protein
MAALTLVPDAWVKGGVGDVDYEVHEHLHPGEDEDEPLHDRVVALEHGIDREPPEAGDVEHRLGDDDPGDQERDADADQ